MPLASFLTGRMQNEWEPEGNINMNGKLMLLNVHIVSKKDEFQDSIEQMQWIWTLTLGKCKLIVVADLWYRKALYSLLIFLQFETITAKTYFSFQVPFSIERESPNVYSVGRKANPPGPTLVFPNFCHYYMSLYTWKRFNRTRTKYTCI